MNPLNRNIMANYSIYPAQEFQNGNMVSLGFNAVYCKDTPDALEAIRSELAKNGKVEVNNSYESFYGVTFDGWLRQGVQNIAVDIEAFSEVSWLEFPTRYIITKK